MKFSSNCTIGKVDTYISKDGSKGANILLFELGANGLDTLEVMTKDMSITEVCSSNVNQKANVTLDITSNKFGTRVNLVSVHFGKQFF